MDFNEFEKNYVFTTKVELDDENFIVLREPTTLELKDMGKDEGNNAELLIKLFPSCIVEHTFTNNGKPASNKAVGEMLTKSSSRFFPLIQVWMESLPLNEKKSLNLDK